MRSQATLLLLMFAVGCQSKPSQTAQQKPDTLAVIAQPTGTNTQAKPNESAVAPEKKTPGEIPDTQGVVKKPSAGGGFGAGVPEGRGRKGKGTDVSLRGK